MTGYQEIFTDPSYFGQIMVTTNAHIGNYGVLDKENQSKEIRISGLICKNFNFNYSRPSATESLFSFLEVLINEAFRVLNINRSLGLSFDLKRI